MFYDRIEAGFALAQELKKNYANENGVVLAVPRGGVPLAYVVAKELGYPLDILLTRKIGHPMNKEYAIGAVCLTDSYIVPHEEVQQEYIDAEILSQREKLLQMQKKFKGLDKPVDLHGKTVIVIDDGIATGNTLMASIRMLKKSKPAKIVIAVPVAPQGSVNKLSAEVDEVVTLLIPEFFYGVGAFYEVFEQVSDEEVLHYLEEARKETILHKSQA